MEALNWALIKHPMNWVTIIMMVFVAGIAVHLVLTHLSTK